MEKIHIKFVFNALGGFFLREIDLNIIQIIKSILCKEYFMKQKCSAIK